MEPPLNTNCGWRLVESKSDVDIQLLTNARAALRAANVGALEHLQRNPCVSTVDLAKRLGDGASAIGMTMVLYEEARRSGRVRNLAQELLYRKILSEFPDGWKSGGRIHASVKLGGWHYDIIQNASAFADCSEAILRELAIEEPPPAGWLPSGADDLRLRALFEAHWK